MYSSEQLFQGAELPFAVLISFLMWPFVDESDVLDCACDQVLGSSATCYLYMLHVHSALPRMLIVYSC